jgi:hypothetical protein
MQIDPVGLSQGADLLQRHGGKCQVEPLVRKIEAIIMPKFIVPVHFIQACVL